jgi:hypothetical protein
MSLFANSALPFSVAASSQNDSEPLLPLGRQAYGFNVLKLKNEGVALLDIPQLDCVCCSEQICNWRILELIHQRG